MTHSHATPAAPEPIWQLLAQVVVPGEAGSENRVAGLAVEAVRDLNLPPAQLQVVREAVADAVRQINTGRDARQPALPISITLFVSSGRAGASDPAPQTGAAPERRGWGCFVVKRLVDGVPAVGVEAHYKIELFLYPEGKSAARDSGEKLAS
jgi:hypothetical protein